MYEQVLTFWFDESTPDQWFKKDLRFDAIIQQQFGDVHRQASASELSDWRETPTGSLAEIIVLDQFSRNIYRDKPESFASDPLALALAQTAIAKGFDKKLSEQQRTFLYMPFMHSESAIIHKQAVALFTDLGITGTLEFEFKHKAIIDRFGRYPHRNAILGRHSTPAELAFLNEPNSSF